MTEEGRPLCLTDSPKTIPTLVPKQKKKGGLTFSVCVLSFSVLIEIRLGWSVSFLGQGTVFFFSSIKLLRKVLLIPIRILYLVDRHYNRCMGQGATTWFLRVHLLLIESFSLTGHSEYCEIPRIE